MKILNVNDFQKAIDCGECDEASRLIGAEALASMWKRRVPTKLHGSRPFIFAKGVEAGLRLGFELSQKDAEENARKQIEGAAGVAGVAKPDN